MTDKERQIKNSFIYLIPLIVSGLLPIVALTVFTRVLTKEDFGALALAQIYAIFASGLANFGLTVVYERNFFQYRDPEKSADLLYSTLVFVITVFLVFVLLTYIFKIPFSSIIIGSPGHAALLFWTFCSTGFLSFKTFFLTYFKNAENARDFTKYTIYESVLAVLFSVFAVIFLRTGIIGIVWGQLSAGLIVFSVLVIKFLKFLPFSFNWRILKESLKLSYPFTSRVFFGVISTQFDKYMIGLLATISGVGIYSIGQRVSYAVFSFMTAIQNVYAPQVYKRMFDEGEKGRESVGKYLTPFAYISVSAALIIALFSEEIISILTPKSYHGAIDIVIILSMFYGSMFFGKQPQLLFAKKTHITSLLTFSTIAVNVGLIIPFTMKWGAVGAAWATLLAGLIAGSIGFIVSQHYYRIKYEYKKIYAIFISFFIPAVMVVLLRYMDVDYYIRISLKLVAIILFAYIGVRINVITMDNFMMVKNIIIRPKTKEVAA